MKRFLPSSNKESGETAASPKSRSKAFRVGGYSVLAAVIVLAILVAANVFINALPSRITRLDVTSNQLFSLSQQTENLLAGLEDDITIYWVVQAGNEDETVGTLLERYAALSSRVTVEKRDPDVYPTLIREYADSVTNNSLIVLSGDRSRYVDYYDIYVYDYSDYYTTYTYDVSFNGESAVTSAIDYVTNDDLPTLYILTGHGEASLSSSFVSALESQNIGTAELSLLTAGTVPEDADCLLIYAPQRDISQEEADALLSYLQNGGRLLLITDPLEGSEGLPLLEELMAGYGVTAEDGIVIEASQDSYAWGTPYYLLPTIQSHDVTSPLIDGGYYVLLPIAQGLTVSDELRDGLTVTELLTTSSRSFSKTAGYDLTTYEKEDGDIDGPFALAVAISETVDEETETRIVWISSGAIVDEDTDLQVSGGNQDLFLNSLSWMCSGQESSISIHAKTLSYEYLTMDSGTASLLSFLIVGAIPVLYLGIGLYIKIRRKRQ